MRVLAALREATFADTRRWTSTDSLRRRLRWDRNTASRILAFHESKGLVAVDPEQFVYGHKVYLTAAGIEEVEWSILHPTRVRADRAPWIVNLLPAFDVFLNLSPSAVDGLLRSLGSTDRPSRESVEQEVQHAGGEAAHRAVRAFLRDPAVETLGTWIAVLIALLAFVQSCQQNNEAVTVQRQVTILQQAFEQAREADDWHQREPDNDVIQRSAGTSAARAAARVTTPGAAKSSE
jgi:hypothetical protein